jgi:hypothetical protein
MSSSSDSVVSASLTDRSIDSAAICCQAPQAHEARMLKSPAMAKMPPALRKALREYLREHLSEIGAKGGKASGGKAVRKWWAAIPPEQRSRIMKERAKKRKKGKKKR